MFYRSLIKDLFYDSFYEVESFFNSFETPKVDFTNLVKEEESFDKGAYNLIVEKWKDSGGNVVYSKKETRPKGWEKIIEIRKLRGEMNKAISELRFEDAATFRDQIKQLETKQLPEKQEVEKEGS